MQIFHRSTNTLAKVTLFGAVAFAALALWVFMVLDRSPYNTRQDEILNQPVPFSHEHHVRGLGIDCRYCHTSVEKTAVAGIPPVATCYNCHKQIWTNSAMLAPVRDGYKNGKPIEWVRVHDLPDYVYFNHSIHVAKGVGCATCHGRVDKMPLMRQHATLQMEWCITCHRNPERYIRPRDQVFNMKWQPGPEGQEAEGRKLLVEYKIQSPRSLTSCSTCHR
ncbi:MAG: cytochrome c3 family protein [Acidobacteriota bacterium]